LIEDVVSAWLGRPALKNRDIERRLEAISQAITFRWIERAIKSLDELVEMMRRNIQKVSALDAFVIGLRYINVGNAPEKVRA
jgi:hypothetical protein